MSQDRYERGLEKIKEIDEEGDDRLTRSLENLKEAAPDLARCAIEFIFGDIFSRPGLDLKSREIVAVAALTAVGSAELPLKSHINGALNVGWSRQEITECILQTAAFAGFPKAVNGMFAAKEVFQARDNKGHK